MRIFHLKETWICGEYSNERPEYILWIGAVRRTFSSKAKTTRCWRGSLLEMKDMPMLTWIGLSFSPSPFGACSRPFDMDPFNMRAWERGIIKLEQASSCFQSRKTTSYLHSTLRCCVSVYSKEESKAGFLVHHIWYRACGPERHRSILQCSMFERTCFVQNATNTSCRV